VRRRPPVRSPSRQYRRPVPAATQLHQDVGWQAGAQSLDRMVAACAFTHRISLIHRGEHPDVAAPFNTLLPTSFRGAGRSGEDAFIESFNSQLCDECLNEHVFVTLAEAYQTIEARRRK